MAEIPNECVQMVCTSPPYWGLRKYEGQQELIWGDNHCEHEWAREERWLHRGSTQSPLENKGGRMTQDKTSDGCCSLCGAWKGAFGLEPTPEMYVQHTIEILREVRRVLRKDGVVFWNIGDSYAAGKGTCFNPGGGKGSFSTHGDRKDAGVYPLDRGNVSMLKAQGLKPKDLCLIPFHIAIAAQQDGWWIRSVIIWNKPNPMPESVTDRPTNSYEFILMLTKSGTIQYWTHPRKRGTRQQPKPDYIWIHRRTGLVVDYQPVSDRIVKKFWTRHNLWRGHDYYWDADAVREPSLCMQFGSAQRDTRETHGIGSGNSGINEAKRRARENGGFGGRNLRDVWTFPTMPYPEAHFAVFPEKLPELCIKAATSEKGCCSKCGAPWARVIAKTGHINSREPAHVPGNTPTKVDSTGWASTTRATDEWRPSCSCGLPPIPCIVLDPFAGTGTTLWVAKKLGRRAIGYDISQAYCQLALERNRQMALAAGPDCER